MADFQPRDVTEHARDIARASPTQRVSEGGADFLQPKARAPDSSVLDPRNEYGHFRISTADAHHLVFGQLQIDLSDVEQITDAAQTRAIGRGIDYARTYLDGHTALREAVERVMADVHQGGLDVLDPRHTGDLAAFRGLDLAAALNRVRGLRVSQRG